MFGKKKASLSITTPETFGGETFEMRKTQLINRRKAILDEAMSRYPQTSEYTAYFNGCKRYLRAAEEAATLPDLIRAERLSNPCYLLPRRSRNKT